MNSDRVKGKAKDVEGRIERQAGEWTGNTELQIRGAAKQAEGKVQDAVGKLKDAVKKPSDHHDPDETQEIETIPDEPSRRRA